MYSQAVEATVLVDDQPVSPTNIETEVSSSSVSNVGTVTGYVDDPTDIEKNDLLSVYANGERLFAGNVKRVTQSYDGAVTIEAYDTFYDMHDAAVVEQTEGNRYLNEIARDLLQEFADLEPAVGELAGRQVDPDELPAGSLYVAPGSEFPGGDTPTNKSWGSGKHGESLREVLQEIADSLLGVFWTDQRNVLRIEPYPDHEIHDAKYVEDTESGQSGTNSDTVKRVIVESPSGGVGGSPAVAYIERLFSTNGVAEYTDVEDGQTVAIRQPNSATQTESEKRALAELLNIGLDEESGTLTFVGTADPSPWNEIRVPEHDRVSLAQGEYGISRVSHVISPQEGWTVDVSLTPTLTEKLEVAQCSSGVDQEYLILHEASQTDAGDIELTRKEST